jgi:hypothetical protein
MTPLTEDDSVRIRHGMQVRTSLDSAWRRFELLRASLPTRMDSEGYQTWLLTLQGAEAEQKKITILPAEEYIKVLKGTD